ncbi:MAG: carboxypeptidase-like regulatory domain-containing protein [Bacteroidetes bacterium]|jgi:TonB-dependent receptor|nr:carboxypeptidase-like regulatory domain-containing protein [Bacteroidota bacterium]
MKKYIFFIISALVLDYSFAQGTIVGSVSDASNGEMLLGATIILESNNTGTMSSFDGTYSIADLELGTYKLVCRFIAYGSVEKVVTIVNNDTIRVDFMLNQSVIAIEQEALVVVRQNRSNQVYMENIKKKETSMVDYISAQEISRNGDSDVSSAIKRVSGVYTMGNFVVVRGLSDRYVRTALNGAEVPSLDPKRSSVSMDLFPTNLIDNILVVKTLNANLPSNYTGAYINVITKDFPDRFTLNFTTSTGFNTNSSFNDRFITSHAGTSEAFGWDNGALDIPDIVAENEVQAPQYSNYYDALVLAGFGEALNEMNILSPDDIGTGHNQTSISNIVNSIDGIENLSQVNIEYMTSIREQQNQTLSDQTKSFANTWEPINSTAPLNLSKSISFGNVTELFGRPFGYNFGLQYKINYRFYENGNTGRYLLTGLESEKNELDVQKQFSDTRGTRSVFTSALFNLGYEFSPNSKIGLTYMPNVSGVNDARYQDGINPSDAVGLGQEQRQQRYLERSMNIFQLRGEHKLHGSANHKVMWSTSFTVGNQTTPDLRLFINSYEELPSGIIYLDADGTNVTDEAQSLLSDGENLNDYFPGYSVDVADSNELSYSIQDNLYPSPTRFFRQMRNTTLDFKINYELPFAHNLGDKNKLAFGLSMVTKTRDYSENRYSFVSQGVSYNGNPSDYFSLENMNVIPGTSSSATDYLYLRDDTDIQNSYDAFQTVLGAYTMMNISPSENIDINLGLRLEATEMLLESDKLDDETLLSELEQNFRGSLNVLDVLPSLNMKFKLAEMDLRVTNYRFSASQSVARPLFREKAPFSVFDFEIQEQQTGNTALNRTKIVNIDNRFEVYPGLGELFSFSLFYKHFTDPIEQVIISTSSNTEITWKNVDRAQLFGLELEMKKNLGFLSERLNAFNIAFNATYIQSATSIAEDELMEIRSTDPDHKDTRPIYGQSPYIINNTLNYTNDSLGLSINTGFNISGPKLVLITPGGTPDVYDQPRASVDLSVNKSIGNRFTLKLKAQNLLDSQFRQTYDFKGDVYNFQTYTTGRTFTLGLSLNL